MQYIQQRHSGQPTRSSDGKLTEAEFVTAAVNCALERFESGDTDGNGEIEQEELREHHGDRREIREAMRRGAG